MGVHGLWDLLSPVGRPVTLETLENKTLAVDISIWLNQAVKGCRDKDGQSPLNAHLVTVFHRICKLLFYKIKPIFVFDGQPPELKKQTLLERQKMREDASQKSRRISHYIVKKYLMEQLKNPKKKQPTSEQLVVNKPQQEQLPEIQNIYNENETDSDDEFESYHPSIEMHFQNPFSINFETDDFKMLPLDIQHELLTEIKERYKRKCWLEQEEIPENSGEFSNYQVTQLLNRRKIQQKLEDVRKTMSQRSAGFIKEMQLPYLDLEEEEEIPEGRRIMSEENSHFILLKQSKVSGSGLATDDSNQLPNNRDSNEIVIIDDDDKNYESTSKSSNIEIVDLSSTEDKKEVEILKIDSEMKTSIDESNIQHSTSSDKMNVNTESINNDNIQHKIMEKEVLLNIKDKVDDQDISKPDVPVITIQDRLDDDSDKIIAESQSKFNFCEDRENVNKPLDSCFTDEKNEISIISNDTKVDKELDNSCKQNQDNYIKTEISKAVKESHIDEESPTVITIDMNKPPTVDDELFPASIFEEHFSEIGEHVEGKEMSKFSVTNDNLSSDAVINKSSNENVEQEQNDEWEMSIDFENIDELEANVKLLQSEQQSQYRRTLTVTEHMYEETKELLTLFGIPYVNSPAEAEAQCAQLEILSLTNGTITDDSDIWLFGGQKVYKNFFVQKKHVEFFRHNDIKSHFNMDRDKLIAFALLTGSDYTQGIRGVGPVTAMEILSEFPGNGLESLQNFRKWWERFQHGKELPKNSTLVKLQKLELGEGFPSSVVYNAYINPAIDQSAESFSWGHPDLDSLREFAEEKFGWSLKKIDEILLPVMKKINENQTQKRIDSYFTIQLNKKENLFPSKRLQKAVKKMLPGKNDTINEPKNKKKRSDQKKKILTRRRSKPQSGKSGTSKKQPVKVIILSEESSSDSS
ncbi:DNA excision repair protein ERCC-5 homolog [Centruroides vittatus]|uniref:DNA excision repair protein ERCC-5 homolog n=1 Tax=Centruroides vittatus TaxID=120091 RepID=UPI00350FEF33